MKGVSQYTGHMMKANVDKVVVGDLTAYTGSCLDVLPMFPADSVHCVVTSPPYWGLRDYGIGDKGIGLEPTFAMWLDNMVAVMREVRRILRPDGTAWINIGDCYVGSNNKAVGDMAYKYAARGTDENVKKEIPGLAAKQLMMMPARLAIALQADGWWVRSEIIWAKPNPMPKSVTDRPTSAHEKIYLLAKSARYFYDADAVREETIYPDRTYGPSDNHKTRALADAGNRTTGGLHDGRETYNNPAGRNLRNVWNIATAPFPESHFATFPPELARRCIAAGTSEHGVCPKCGAQWERVTETPDWYKKMDGHTMPSGTLQEGVNKGFGAKKDSCSKPTTTLGWRPCCECDAPIAPAVVLDPFGGAFTTALVALKMGRRAVMIELNPAYVAMGLKRCEAEAAQGKIDFGKGAGGLDGDKET